MTIRRRRLRVVSFSISVILACALAVSANAQQPAPAAGQLNRFEVATIKPVEKGISNQMVGTDIDPGGVVRVQGLDLKSLLAEAFDLAYWQISGGDAWMSTNRYNVVGAPPEEYRRTMPDTRHTLFTIRDPRLREMLQALLIERFNLKVHRVTQTGKVFFLLRSGKPLLLQPEKRVASGESSSESTFGSIGFGGEWVLSDTTMQELARFGGSFYVHRPIVDRTGLSGAFNYRSQPQDWTAAQADRTGSFLQLLNESGLKLEAGRGEVESLVIDHADPPTPN